MLDLPKKRNSSGQALLLVLLSLAVVLTVALYVLSKSVTDISISTRSEDSMRAFSAAEAGIEKVLITGSSAPNQDIGNAKFDAKVTNIASGTTFYNYPQPLSSGGSAVLWLVGHGGDGKPLCNDTTNICYKADKLKICWGAPGAAPVSAIEASIFYADRPNEIVGENYSSVKVARVALDPDFARGNSFSQPDVGGCTIDGKKYEYQKTLDFKPGSLNIPYSNPYNLLLIKVTMFYNTTPQYVGFESTSPSDIFSSQGILIESVGTSGDSNRKIEVSQGWSEVPQIFNSVVFGGVSK